MILYKTNGGLDVFRHYLGEDVRPGKKIRNPFYDDTRAGCSIFYGHSGGRYFFTDFGDSTYKGDCFWLAAKMEHLDLRTDFEKVLKIIDKRMCLNVFDDNDVAVSKQSNRTAVAAARTSERSETPTRTVQPFRIEVKDAMSDKERAYWQQYGIDKYTLERYGVKALSSFSSKSIEGNEYTISSNSGLLFGYLFNGGEGVKIYRPGQQHRFLYAGNTPSPYIFGFDLLPDIGDVLYVTGGEKDVMTLASHGFAAVSLNSETAKIPKTLAENAIWRFNGVVVLYDTDATGIAEAQKRTQEFIDLGCYNAKALRLPLDGTKESKDVSDFFKAGHQAQELVTLTEELNNERHCGIGR